MAEKKSKQRAAEIERLTKLKEALDKKEPMQEKELQVPKKCPLSPREEVCCW